MKGYGLNKNKINGNKPKVDYRFKKKSIFTGRSFFQGMIFIFSTLIYNIIGNLFGLYLYFLSPTDKRTIRKIVFLGFGGIGNHLMLGPAIRSLKKMNSELNIHLVASSKTCAELLANNSGIDSISVMNIGCMGSILYYIKGGLALRELKPDVILAAAGTDVVAGSLVSIFSGAHTRIGEDWRGRGIFYSHKIKVNLHISESEQNLNLVRLLNPKAKYHSPKLDLAINEIKEAYQWKERLNLPEGTKLFGIHPGSGKKQKWKRWKLENFIEVVKAFSENKNIIPIFFIGPDERELHEKLINVDLYSAIISMESDAIRKTAAKIGCCNLFLSNDSGLRHIAAAQRISTIAIFGPTSREKNFYNDGKSRIIYRKDVACSPCHYTKWWLSCGEARSCLEKISVNEVVEVVSEMLNP